MKKQIFTAILLICVCAATGFADQDKLEKFREELSEAETVQHPIFAKVFPGVLFKEIMSRRSGSPERCVYALYNNEIYVMHNQFNLLYSKVASKSTCTIKERLEAFARVALYELDRDIKVLEFDEVEIKRYSYAIQYRMVIKQEVETTTGTKISNPELLFWIDNDEIREVEFWLEGKCRTMFTPLLFNMMDDIEMIITGTGIYSKLNEKDQVTQELLAEHHYLTVGLGDGPNNISLIPGQSLNFEVTGLQPLATNVVLRIMPLPNNSQFPTIEVPLIVDVNGTATYTWDSFTLENTCIYAPGIVVGGHVNAFPIPQRVIPDMRFDGIVSNGIGSMYYTVYFTNQAFEFYQGSYTNPEFCGHVENAFTASWQKQVNEWGLCLGLEREMPYSSDNLYWIGINDSGNPQVLGNWYRYMANTGGSLGSMRVIGIGSNLNMDPTHDPEWERIYLAMCHEFYHGIQASHNTTGPNHTPLDIKDREIGWMVEGQAVLLTTVFMGEPDMSQLPGAINAAYDDGSLYKKWADMYLNWFWLNQSLQVQTYRYSLFWRFLYEHYGYEDWATRERLAIIRETCHNNGNPFPVELDQVDDFMLNKFVLGGGRYTSMTSALREFVKMAYFNNPGYDNWNPCYDNNTYNTPDIFSLPCQNPQPYYGGYIHHSGDIPSAFGLDYLVYDFMPDHSTVRIMFDRDPDGDQNYTDFYVNVIALDYHGQFIDDHEEQWLFNPGVTEREISYTLDHGDKIVIAIARLGTDESGNTDTDYEVTLRGPEEAWDEYYGGVLEDISAEGHQITVIPEPGYPQDKGYIIVGMTNSFSPLSQVNLVRTYLDGSQAWQRQYNEPGQPARGGSVKQTPDLVVWDQTIGGTESDVASSVQLTSDGGYIFAGCTGSYGSGNDDIWLVKTDQSGDQIWQKTFGGTEQDFGCCVQQTSDGGYIITGKMRIYGVNYACLIKTDEDGDEEWPEPQLYAAGSKGFSVQQTSDGGYIVAGSCGGAAGWPDFYLVKTDSEGEEVWSKTFGGDFTDICESVVQTLDGGYILTGWTLSFGAGERDIFVVRANELGEHIWEHTIGDIQHDWGTCVDQDVDGGYFITGHTKGVYGGTYDFYACKINPDDYMTECFGVAPGVSTLIKPIAFSIGDNYPNPFNPVTTLVFDMPEATKVNLDVYNISGRLVKTLVNGWRDAGSHEVTFNASNLASGIYLYRLTAGDFTATKKMVLIK